jgi:ubiquinone/menaquinone biosynthesis C-methylase UbiE
LEWTCPQKRITLAENKAQINRIQNVTFRVADTYSLPFGDENFDVVLLTNLLHIVAETVSVLQEARRLLRPDGVLAAVTDCMAEPGPFKNWLQALGIRAMKLFGNIKYFHFFHKSDLKDLLKNNGFLIQKEAEFHNAPVNYYLTAIKKG